VFPSQRLVSGKQDLTVFVRDDNLGRNLVAPNPSPKR